MRPFQRRNPRDDRNNAVFGTPGELECLKVHWFGASARTIDATAKAANPRPDWVTEYINYDFSKETFEEDLDAPVAEATMEEILDDVETTEE